MFSLNSKIKDVVNNPIGKDLFFSMLSEMNATQYYDLMYNKVIQQLKLKQLTKFPLIDQSLLEVICQKMNHYEGEVLNHSTGKLKKAWWKESVCYQIYPRSFNDSNGDGIGDINGIIKKLDYLKELGVDVIWLSPIYDSPNDDNGYDIRHYDKILKDFGSMYDFDRLLVELHLRGMKLIMDLVINHTSDEHEWFKLSRLNDEKYKDYYIWRDQPNNWQSMFKGSAWSYDESRDSYYMHIFSKKQVDLNWENEDMRNDLYQMINWWLDKGIDGFRLDVINFISKEDDLPDGNLKLGEVTDVLGLEHYMYGPKVHEYLKELNEATFSKYDVMTVGECPGVGLEMAKYFVHEDRNELDMIFNFDHLYSGTSNKWLETSYDINHLSESLLRFQDIGSSCWNSIFLNNHDTPRMISKLLKEDTHRLAVSKMLALITMTLRGTPYIYQGQEIGMMNPTFKSIDEFRDIESHQVYDQLIAEGKTPDEVIEILNNGSRDNSRTVMSWNDELNAGFSTGDPWIKVNDDYKSVNVKAQLNDCDSTYHFYKNLIKIRKENLTLIYGKTLPVHKKLADVMSFKRQLDKDEFLVVINLSDNTRDIPLSMKKYNLIVSNYADANVLYKPYEARLYKRTV